ncbi:MAG: AMIN domain-containing protein, partial [Desulfobacterota bacterium]|nr:AMIN domain-containing protein [Thermodesulfobacteriota bacterium]
MKLMNYQGLIFKRLLLFLSVMLLLGGCASSPPPKPAAQQTLSPEEQSFSSESQPSATLISQISTGERDDAFTVVISGSEPLIYEVSELEDPPRLVVEVAGAKLAFSPRPISVENGVIKEIFSEEQEKEGKPLSRIEVVLTNLTHYEVLPSGNNLEINLSKPLPTIKAAGNIFEFSIDEGNKDYVRVNIIGDGTITNFNSFTLRNPTRLVIDFY